MNQVDEHERDLETLKHINTSAISAAVVVTLALLALSWADTRNYANLMGVLLSCSGFMACGAWVGFLYATFGQETERFKGPFSVVNAFLGGAAITDITKEEKSVILAGCTSLSEFCGFAGNISPVILAAITFAFCGFMVMYYAKMLLLNVATQRQANQLGRLRSDAIETMTKDSPLAKTEPGKAPALSEKVQKAVDILTSQGMGAGTSGLEALRAQGEAHFLKGNLAKATQLLKEALALNPNDPVTQTSLAQVYIAKNQVAKAIEHLDTAAKSPEAPPYLWRLMGYAYLWDERRVDEAAAASRRYLSQYPNDNGALLNLACAHGQKGPSDPANKQECLRLLSEVFKNDPEERETVRQLMRAGGDFHLWRNDPEFQTLVNPD